MRKNTPFWLATAKASQKPAARKPFSGLIISLILFAAAAFLSYSGHAANVLSNPGFETGDPSGWVKYGVFDFNTTNNVYYNGCNCGSNVWIYDGRYSGKTYGQFTGGENYNGEYQDVP